MFCSLYLKNILILLQIGHGLRTLSSPVGDELVKEKKKKKNIFKPNDCLKRLSVFSSVTHSKVTCKAALISTSYIFIEVLIYYTSAVKFLIIMQYYNLVSKYEFMPPRPSVFLSAYYL